MTKRQRSTITSPNEWVIKVDDITARDDNAREVLFRKMVHGVAIDAGLPAPEFEFCFSPPRRWRVDIAFPYTVVPVALEVEGGTFAKTASKQGGRHTTGVGFLNDMEKYNALQSLGWSLFRATPTPTVYRYQGKRKRAPWVFDRDLWEAVAKIAKGGARGKP